MERGQIYTNMDIAITRPKRPKGRFGEQFHLTPHIAQLLLQYSLGRSMRSQLMEVCQRSSLYKAVQYCRSQTCSLLSSHHCSAVLKIIRITANRAPIEYANTACEICCRFISLIGESLWLWLLALVTGDTQHATCNT